MYRAKKPHSIHTTSHSIISTPKMILVIGKIDGCNSFIIVSFSLSTNLVSITVSLIYCIGAQIISKSAKFSFQKFVSYRT